MILRWLQRTLIQFAWVFFMVEKRDVSWSPHSLYVVAVNRMLRLLGDASGLNLLGLVTICMHDPSADGKRAYINFAKYIAEDADNPVTVVGILKAALQQAEETAGEQGTAGAEKT